MEEKLSELRHEIDVIDSDLAFLFEKRMGVSKKIANLKKESGKAVFDESREKAVIERGKAAISDPELRAPFAEFISNTIKLSREYQNSILNPKTTEPCVTVTSAEGKYDIYIGNGISESAADLFDLSRKVLVVTDDFVPPEYSDRILSLSFRGRKAVIPHGEKSKSFESVEFLLSEMLSSGFTRNDAVVAVGGGMTGDVAGLAASLYMRGIDFYQIPTTLLSQIDSSVGGKSAIDFSGVKNSVGCIRAPKGVIADTSFLKTLPEREFSSGLAEAIKISAVSDAETFSLLEGDIFSNLDAIIHRCVSLKSKIVEADEKDKSVRRCLNFGHTIGHAIEAAANGKLTHGESVAVGMLPFSSDSVKERLLPIYERTGLNIKANVPFDDAMRAVLCDKKRSGDSFSCVFCDSIGSYRTETLGLNDILHLLKGATE